MDYAIFATEDLSFITTIRIQFRIQIGADPGDERILEICEEIQEKQPPHHAISFQFYLPELDPDAGGDAWKFRPADVTVDWAPGGIWKEADRGEVGDYSKHKFKITRPGG